MSSQRPPSSSKSRSFSNLEAKDILKEPRRKRGDESIWTTSDDPEIAHIEFEKTRAEDYDLPIGWSKYFLIT